MSNLTEPGFTIGPIYALTVERRTEFMPREAISFVSAEYRSQPGLIVLAGLAIVGGLLALGNPETIFAASDADPLIVGWAAIVIGVAFLFGYLGSRRVGITIASSGGRLFVESRGRGRAELLRRIHDDLAAHRRADGVPLRPESARL